ncbi:hypothetical protein PPTG_23816 [Phytophthora nicotianae INRA-310]|uniref:Uncharacterized protein n=1 Tax=Phytophthora nicotianae (strain INRA-310) TaxID=761204 RepID=W2PQS2_PHYN3|nr:hypothetical protein PPTG_23816 [Phytophthora nicotianae INRA-310]ETN03308.1 hypothetical protein PPTG_23816 [Phytophthora nicotianae INRA-310]
MPILELYLTITDSDDLPIFIYCAATRKTGGVEQTFSVPTSIYTPFDSSLAPRSSKNLVISSQPFWAASRRA